MTPVYTHTLETGQILAVNAQINFGEIFIAGLALLLIALAGLDLLFMVVYRR